jgi:hypothetical protein
MGWVHWFQHVPTLKKLRNAAEGVTRRVAHSFFNHDKDTLKGATPILDRTHDVINAVGKLVLPDPRLLDHFDDKVKPVIHPHSFVGRAVTHIAHPIITAAFKPLKL